MMLNPGPARIVAAGDLWVAMDKVSDLGKLERGCDGKA
jgi:hypothetical protein